MPKEEEEKEKKKDTPNFAGVTRFRIYRGRCNKAYDFVPAPPSSSISAPIKQPKMDKASSGGGRGATIKCHVVAMPFPGRGHINPMMNFCKLLASNRPNNTIIITFIVTEEWNGFLSSDSLPANLRLTTIPNIIPSEIGRGKDWPGFVRAALTKLEVPVEDLLDRLAPLLPKPNVIIYDTYLKWVVKLGNRRNIPVASFWTQSATVFSIFHHFDLIVKNRHFNANLEGQILFALLLYITSVSATVDLFVYLSPFLSLI